MNISKLRLKLTVTALTFLMAVLFMSVSAFAADGTISGEGTETSPYLIEDAADFAAMGTSGIFKLANDITVTAPYENDFAGTFDGDGHTVTLNITSETASTGLFKNLVSGAAVRNLTTKGTITISGNRSYTGALAANANGNDGGVTIEGCLNQAEINGYKAVGGLIGRAYNGVTINACANAGTITGGNTQVGGIVGNVSAGTVTISNCYNAGTVTGFNMVGGIIGQTTKSGPTDNLINCYDIGSCTITSSNSNVGALIGNKSNNGTLTNCYFLETAAAAAVGGATVEGAASKTEAEMKAAEFVTALGEAFVADSGSINGGYPILNWQASGGEPEDTEANLAAVTAAKTAFDKESGALRPAFKTDKNIAAMVQAKVDAYEGCEGVVVSLKSSDEPDWIAADGTIKYNTGALNSWGMNSKNVYCVFTFTKGTQAVDSAQRTATVGWDQEYYSGKMAAEAEGLTADQIKGANASLDEVTENLTLPQCMTDSSRTAWSQITWTSSNEDVIKIDKTGYDGITDPKQGTVTRPAEDTEVTLTATFNANEANLNTNVEKVSDFEPTVKTFKVTVKKTEAHVWTEEELQAILDQYYTADLLKDSATQEPLDANAVKGDIQLPRYTTIKDSDGNLVFQNKEITVTSANEDIIKINGYRAAVDRFGINVDTAVNLTVSYKKLDQEITVTKTIPVTVKAITEEEIADELTKMQKAKDAYEAAILDGQDKASVTENLHAFQEINFDADGNAVVAYSNDQVTEQGIKADGYWNSDQSAEMEASGYNRFKSSEPTILQHENLVLAQRPELDTQVTITSWLSSAKYAEAAANHPDNAVLKTLYKQEVSATVTVKGTKAPADFLHDAIEEAKELSEQIEEGEEPGQYPAGTKAALDEAIAAAQAVADKADATDEELNAAIEALNKAVKDAEEKKVPVEAVEINTSIAFKGELKVVYEAITVGDEDNDGVLTINDALIETHKQFAPNGVDDYAYEQSQWGLSVAKLWGDTSYEFGYYLNDEMAMSAGDPIDEGDDLYAWVYKKAYPDSEAYSYFDEKEIEGVEGEEVELLLNYNSGWDENYNPVFAPLAGASVGYYNDGAFVELGKTNAEGAVTFEAPAGEFVVTAVGPEGTEIIPPYCVLKTESKEAVLNAAKEAAIKMLEKQIAELKTDENADELDAILKIAEKDINAIDSIDDLDVIAAIAVKTAAEIDRAASASLETVKAAARQELLTALKDAIDAGKIDPSKGLEAFLKACEAIDSAKSAGEIDVAKSDGQAAFNKLIEEKAAAGKKTAKVVKGKTYKYKGQSYKVTKVAKGKTTGTVTFTKAKNAKKVTVPATIKLADKKTYKVTVVGAKAFTAKKIRTATIGANVTRLTAKTFAKSKVTTVIVKTKKLTKKSVKGSLKGSKVKTIKVKAGKKFVKKYKKIFTKKNAGKKVKVK